MRRRARQDAAPPADSWFNTVGVGRDDSVLDGSSRPLEWLHSAAPESESADSRFLARQAQRIVSSGGRAFERVHRAFLAARVVLGLGLLLAQMMGSVFGVRAAGVPLLVALGYAAQTLVLWLLPRFRDRAAASMGRAHWLSTIGLDLVVFLGLYLLHDHSSLNYGALLVLPLLMAGAMMPRLGALATAAGVALVLLAAAWRNVLGGSDIALTMTQAGMAGMGSFVIVLLAGEIAGRLAREERAARSSLELARQQARLNRLVIDEMSEGVLVVDRSGRVRVLNPAARALLSTQARIPPAPVMLGTLPGCQDLAQSVALAFAGQAWPADGRELPLEGGAGGRRLLRVRARFTRRRSEEGDGETEELCVLFAEDLRQVQARQRQDKLAAMGRMSAGIAHEIRNPLAAIAQANALLREDLHDAAAQRLARIVADNAERLRRIVGDVLDLVPGAPAEPCSIEAVEVVATAATEWARTAGVAAAAQGRLRMELPPPPLAVDFEPEHLRRVLVNLLDNAHRHAVPGAGAVLLRLWPESGRVMLSVASDGPPIAPEVERHLFEPFFSTRSRGTGLGLYICRELCERHGATIDFRLRGAARHRNEFLITLRPAAGPSSSPP